MAKAIDTLRAHSILTDAGVPKKQADALVNVISEVNDASVSLSDLKLTEAELKNQISLLRRDLTIKIYSIGLAIAGLMAAFNLIG